MTQKTTTQPSILIVDDQSNMTEILSIQLGDEYTVQIANSGTSALKMIDEEIDVVLLDRRMPGLSGDEVLRRIRFEGYNCRVVMLTAAVPNFDIIELPFDDYVCKPVDHQTLTRVIDYQLKLRQSPKVISDLYKDKLKQRLIQREKSSRDLNSSPAYQELNQQIISYQKQAEGLVSDLDSFESAFESIHSESIYIHTD